ncbi:hypothetical protein, partial [Candidatus Ichthyocystis hellenicum]|uniref:hypothetical protein n=1 Tax=Candidatus Ichthyocystis hellenicum TaxID=1561003 RepID=UPI001F5FEEDF
IMLKLMNYWNSFCAINRDFLSLLPVIDYSNPFIASRDNCGFILPDVSSPAAFSTVHGIYLSFMAVNCLDNIIKNLVLTIIDVLRPVILGRLTIICTGLALTEELRKSVIRKLLLVIYREFSGFVASHVESEITRSLNESLIWLQR